MLWWKLDWRSHLGERCQSPRQLARHIQNRMARSLVGSTARTCLWKNIGFAPHWAELSQPVKALWRSQRGPLASVALTALPTSRATGSNPIPHLVVSPSSPTPSSQGFRKEVPKDGQGELVLWNKDSGGCHCSQNELLHVLLR